MIKDYSDAHKHEHAFCEDKKHLEAKMLIVFIITLATMFLEIFFGWISNSMALFADGWHMGTHAFALGISLAAYVLARKYAKDNSFVFGTWKIEILGAYSSAIVLGMIGVGMIYTSIERLIHPLSIHYNQALIVAIIGFVVNLLCAMILKGDNHTHYHEHEHKHNEHDHKCHEYKKRHDDLNFQSAYLHVIVDAITSLLAIFAILSARRFNANWIDPFMGILGAILIIRWSFTLLKNTSNVLLDHETNQSLFDNIKKHICSFDDLVKINDIHLWRIADEKYACIISVSTEGKYESGDYKSILVKIRNLVHVTIEVNHFH